MACKSSFELHHQFPRLAEESGFTFNTDRPRVHIDWNKIRMIDVDSLIRERKFVLIEQHLNDILDCVLESASDVRILDEGVLKMFRLAQLAVEYQQFCRHYLDRSVYVLRKEITSLAQELDSSKKDLREKDEEIRKLRKRSRHSYKSSLPYGNDNIATMILKTLNHKSDILLPTTSNDNLQYNKCNYCEKVFLNQLYLKSHITRRHPNVEEPPQKDEPVKEPSNDNTKLSIEIAELKSKLKEMEVIIANATNQSKPSNFSTIQPTVTPTKTNVQNVELNKKEMVDTGVSTNNEDYLLNKLEEWKKEEHATYNKEIDKLRSQIMETINSLKDKEPQKLLNNDSNLIQQLHTTIKHQGEEIQALKHELNNSKVLSEKYNAERIKESESQISYWAKRAEDQTKQYEQLLQKLNDVAQDARKSRALAEAETQRATQLQALLEQKNTADIENSPGKSDKELIPNHKPISLDSKKKILELRQHNNNLGQEEDKTLELLQRKAQELLNIGSGSSTSDVSSIDKIKPLTNAFFRDERQAQVDKKGNMSDKEQKPNDIKIESKRLKRKEVNQKQDKIKAPIKNIIDKNSIKINPGSPAKLVRAKITEEVNIRLVSAGVDPIKCGIPRCVFQKKRSQLQQQLELKTKKNPSHEKIRHSILAYLDTSVTNLNKEVIQPYDCISSTKSTKPFHNLSSMISNVKSKALSLVKLNDVNVKNKKKSLDAEVAKRAVSLLKTPPGSTTTSPVITKHSPSKDNYTNKYTYNLTNPKRKSDHESGLENPKNYSRKTRQLFVAKNDTDNNSEESDDKYYKTTHEKSTKSIENLIQSPARRPSSASADYGHNITKYTVDNDNIMRTQSASNLTDRSIDSNVVAKITHSKKNEDSSDDVESLSASPEKNNFSSNLQSTIKQTKSVLKNASSMSSLNKKKVLFDMDAIQMKSVSASPSQSTTEKSDGNEKYELGLVNLDGEEWDISSIENEPLKHDTKIQNITQTRTSPKIAELKEKIESQLARRQETPTLVLAGKVDVLAGTMAKVSSIGGSNTSLGSSILDDSEIAPVVNHKAFVKPKKNAVNDYSDIDISDFSVDGIATKNESF